ncbi:unnamed protein product [Closterium sp. NIES-64]|nr:unnamed protein product [Closterium sp. NIES-64]
MAAGAPYGVAAGGAYGAAAGGRMGQQQGGRMEQQQGGRMEQQQGLRRGWDGIWIHNARGMYQQQPHQHANVAPQQQQEQQPIAFQSPPSVCQQFALADLARAMGGWAESNRIGSGSFGDVYKVVSPFDPSVLWAVKRARLLTKDFQREMDGLPSADISVLWTVGSEREVPQVAAMATKHHPNLVRLLGYCIDMHPAAPHSTQGELSMEQIVVYEFMANGDLERWVGEGAAQPLAVAQPPPASVDTTFSYRYTHHSMPSTGGIVHRDFKPANILLDGKFGVSRILAGVDMHPAAPHSTQGDLNSNPPTSILLESKFQHLSP